MSGSVQQCLFGGGLFLNSGILRNFTHYKPHYKQTNPSLFIIVAMYKIRHHQLFGLLCIMILSNFTLNAQTHKIDSLSRDITLYNFVGTIEPGPAARFSITKIDELLAQNPSDSLANDLIWKKIKNYERLGQYSDAITICKELLNKNPSQEEEVTIYYNLANLYSNANLPREAMACARRALEVSPNAIDSLYSKIAIRDAFYDYPDADPEEIIDLCYDILSTKINGTPMGVCDEYLTTLDCLTTVCDIPSKDLDEAKIRYKIAAEQIDSIPNLSMRALSSLYILHYQEYGARENSYLEKICELYNDFLRDEINGKNRVNISDNCREVVELYIQTKLVLAQTSENEEECLKHINDLVRFFSHNGNSTYKTAADSFESIFSSIYDIRQEYYRQVLDNEFILNSNGLKTPDDLYTIFEQMNKLLHQGLSKIQVDLGHLTNPERSVYLGDYDRIFSDAIFYSQSNIDINGKFRKNAFEICSFYQGLLLATEKQFINGKLKDTDTTDVRNYTYDNVENQLNLTNNCSLYLNFVRYQRDFRNYHYGAFIFNKDMKVPHFVDLCSETDLKDQLTRGYNIYNDSLTYKLIFGSIESYLDKHDKVVIIPDGLLNAINFEALKTPIGNSFYQTKDIQRISTIREIFTNRQNLQPDYAVLFGGLQYYLTDNEYKKVRKTIPSESHGFRSVYSMVGNDRRSIRYLPESKAEIDILSQMLEEHHIDYKTYTGIYGTEEVFKSLSGRRIPILHLATHGFYYDKDQLEKAAYLEGYDKFSTYDYYESGLLHSGLILSGGAPAFNGVSSDRQEDGVLLGEEIASMDLSQTDLVVLSACETGMGDTTSEGLIGLQRAFKKAGAKTLILTLWPVNDACTRDFMAAFYENLLSGEDKHEAFFSAVDSIRETYKNPHLWAPFIMVD